MPILLLVFALLADSASATTVERWTLTGRVTRTQSPDFPLSVAVGDPFRINLSFDSSAPNEFFEPDQGLYSFYPAVGRTGGFSATLRDISLSLQGLQGFAINTANDHDVPDNPIVLDALVVFGHVTVIGMPALPVEPWVPFQLTFRDESASALNTIRLPSDPIDPLAFAVAEFGFGDLSTPGGRFAITADVLAIVNAPAAASYFLLASFALARRLTRQCS